jgi:hypothetical protein
MLQLTSSAWENENIIYAGDEETNNEETEVDDIVIQSNESNLKSDTDSSVWLSDLFRWYKSEKSESELAKSPMLVAFRKQVGLILDGMSDMSDDWEWQAFQSRSYYIRDYLKAVFMNHDMVDAAICCSDESPEILCHQCILTANCGYFEAILGENWSSSENNDSDSDGDTKLDIRKLSSDANSKHVRLLLEYFYGVNIFAPIRSLSVVDAMEIYSLGHYWSCSSTLLDIITEFIYRNVSEDESLHVLSFADTYELSRLKDKCFTMAIKGMTVSDSDKVSAYDEVLAPGVQDCIASLRKACRLVHSKHNYQVDCSVREMVAIMKEALEEEEEIWKISWARNNEEISRSEGSRDSDYISRLKSVQATLNQRAVAISQRKEFVNKQIQYLQFLGLQI